MTMSKVLVGFVPWSVFSLFVARVGPGAVAAACVLALLVAAGLVMRSLCSGESPKLLEIVAVVVFFGLAVVAFTVPTTDGFLAGYGRALAAAILAVVILGLAPVLPFTEQYARESVPREYWHTPAFRSVNRRLSTTWGGVVAAMAVSHTAAGFLELPDPGVGILHRPIDLLFNWIVPALLVWAAVHYTQRVSDAAGSRALDAVVLDRP
jgi:hypothetical protein